MLSSFDSQRTRIAFCCQEQAHLILDDVNELGVKRMCMSCGLSKYHVLRTLEPEGQLCKDLGHNPIRRQSNFIYVLLIVENPEYLS